VIAIVIIAGCVPADSDRRGIAQEYRPANELARFPSVAVDGDDIGLVRDFDIGGDSIYLLDAGGRVIIAIREGAAIRVVGHFGRSGGGPGELTRPTGLALAGSDIVVADGTRLQFFSRDGEFLSTKRLSPPCPMMLPKVAPSRVGVFVHGGCLRRGYTTDTMKAVLAWSRDTVKWEIIVETPRFTTDGSLGSVFGPASLMAIGVRGAHAFGGGERNCIWRIEDGGDRPIASEICPAVSTLYRADPPPGLEARMRSARFAGMNLRWPASLPAYGDSFVTGSDMVLFRPFTADSLVLQLASPSALDIAVAPHDGLLGCKAGGCVWLMDETATPRMIVLDRTEMEALVQRASGK
jgi:hypothetical protein